MNTRMRGMFQGPDGKYSFGRIFGAAFLVSALLGWWLSLLSGLWQPVPVALPELTNELLIIAIAPYSIGKVSGAIGSNSKAKKGENGNA